jgi:pyruvate formate lyase activating enzyme
LTDWATPEAVVDAALESGCKSIAFTYNDPVIFAEYAIDCAVAARERGIHAVAVSAGYMQPAARAEFYRYVDAANIDLKAFTEEFYHRLCLGSLQPVLDTLCYLRHETKVWFEVTTLLIPGKNDSAEEIERLSGWFMENLGPDVPLHFSAFHPDFKMLDLPPTPPETLIRARNQARAAGLRYVYTGNVHDRTGQSTYCPSCGNLLIERDWYELGEWNLESGGLCRACRTAIPGRFDPEPGNWGRRRRRVFIHN